MIGSCALSGAFLSHLNVLGYFASMMAKRNPITIAIAAASSDGSYCAITSAGRNVTNIIFISVVRLPSNSSFIILPSSVSANELEVIVGDVYTHWQVMYLQLTYYQYKQSAGVYTIIHGFSLFLVNGLSRSDKTGR